MRHRPDRARPRDTHKPPTTRSHHRAGGPGHPAPARRPSSCRQSRPGARRRQRRSSCGAGPCTRGTSDHRAARTRLSWLTPSTPRAGKEGGPFPGIGFFFRVPVSRFLCLSGIEGRELDLTAAPGASLVPPALPRLVQPVKVRALRIGSGAKVPGNGGFPVDGAGHLRTSITRPPCIRGSTMAGL
jgi:hypothetical protein